METLIQKLKTGWSVMRVVRLGFALWMLVAGIQMKDWLFVLFGIGFGLMALTNTGCCSTAGCYTPQKRNTTKAVSEDIEYEEIK
jgi:hypothetical protein